MSSWGDRAQVDGYKPTLRIAESAERGTGAQPFRCNYDMRNSEASCYVNHFVIRA